MIFNKIAADIFMEFAHVCRAVETREVSILYFSLLHRFVLFQRSRWT